MDPDPGIQDYVINFEEIFLKIIVKKIHFLKKHTFFKLKEQNSIRRTSLSVESLNGEFFLKSGIFCFSFTVCFHVWIWFQ